MNLEGVHVAPARFPGYIPNRLGQNKLSSVHREEMPVGIWGWVEGCFRSTNEKGNSPGLS